jgi:hypothetical protein
MKQWRFALIPAVHHLFKKDDDESLLAEQASHVSTFEAEGWTIFSFSYTYGGQIFVAMYKETP